ncbi:MAG: hypothetical protein Q8Q08_04725 [Candidatus Omnitrophota bacterium]|nr:hypothetical protein [Candidatus Omnitrophota bacterium]MDZ4242233.1 hypothetical protein [Candidatus Omnitrophota bacterium]
MRETLRLLLSILVLTVILTAVIQKLGFYFPRFSRLPPPAPVQLPAEANRLRLDVSDVIEPVTIPIYPPVELDGKTREDIFNMRKEIVARHSGLVLGEYTPSLHLFGNIMDGRPWWGLKGQYCYADGEKSIEGESEESRFWMNPFLLLWADECSAFRRGENCDPIYLQAVSLEWFPIERKAVAIYDYSGFLQEKQKAGFSSGDFYKPLLMLGSYNARDFGYEYAWVSPSESARVQFKMGQLTRTPSKLDSFVHLGQSCHYPGGCNNASPFEPELDFWVESLPAEIHASLWHTQPRSPSQEADFTFVIKFQ